MHLPDDPGLIFQCAKANMETLTLARFILEFSLMDYPLVSVLDSKVAAACLMLALSMRKLGEWVSGNAILSTCHL